MRAMRGPEGRCQNSLARGMPAFQLPFPVSGGIWSSTNASVLQEENFELAVKKAAKNKAICNRCSSGYKCQHGIKKICCSSQASNCIHTILLFGLWAHAMPLKGRDQRFLILWFMSSYQPNSSKIQLKVFVQSHSTVPLQGPLMPGPKTMYPPLWADTGPTLWQSYCDDPPQLRLPLARDQKSSQELGGSRAFRQVCLIALHQQVLPFQQSLYYLQDL